MVKTRVTHTHTNVCVMQFVFLCFVDPTTNNRTNRQRTYVAKKFLPYLATHHAIFPLPYVAITISEGLCSLAARCTGLPWTRVDISILVAACSWNFRRDHWTRCIHAIISTVACVRRALMQYRLRSSMPLMIYISSNTAQFVIRAFSDGFHIFLRIEALLMMYDYRCIHSGICARRTMMIFIVKEISCWEDGERVTSLDSYGVLNLMRLFSSWQLSYKCVCSRLLFCIARHLERFGS